MQRITWFQPILPGKTESWKAFVTELDGPRRADNDRSRSRVGMTREVASLMQTPQGDFACLYHEADDLARAFAELAVSDDPHDVWFREKLAELHGMTREMMEQPLPATLYLDYEGAGAGAGVTSDTRDRGKGATSDTD